MRDHVIALLLSVMLGGLTLPDTDALADASDRQMTTTASSVTGAVDISYDELVLDDEQLRVHRTRLTPVPDERGPDPDNTKPVYWTVSHRRATSLAAGLWPRNAGTASVALTRVEEATATPDDTAALLAVVLDHCRERGYLKVIVHTPDDLAAAIAQVEQQGFLFNRRHDHHGTAVAEFYRNLYWQPRRDADHG